MSSTRRSVLILGLGSYVDKHASNITTLTSADVAGKVSGTIAEASTLGFDGESFDVNPAQPEATVQRLRETLASKKWDSVSIGFGVRGQIQFTGLFEDCVNTVVEEAPGARFVFSTGPDKVVEGIKRVFRDVPGLQEEKVAQ
ncbi:MAG: hypothetical protein Q9160_007854 [Pyrenula sp. 1 TL-2023]